MSDEAHELKPISHGVARSVLGDDISKSDYTKKSYVLTNDVKKNSKNLRFKHLNKIEGKAWLIVVDDWQKAVSVRSGDKIEFRHIPGGEGVAWEDVLCVENGLLAIGKRPEVRVPSPLGFRNEHFDISAKDRREHSHCRFPQTEFTRGFKTKTLVAESWCGVWQICD